MSARRTPLYLDYAATTPVDPRVAAAMAESLGAEAEFGNPSAVAHLFGQRAAARIEQVREQVAVLLGADAAEIVFTSGATESNNLALLGVARANSDRGRHLVTTRIEHKAVLDPCRHLERQGFEITYLTPDRRGLIDPQAVRAALRPDTLLVSVMLANNETGVLQDVAAIGAICREQEVLFHTDAAQAAGKIPLRVHELPVDLLSFTAHKIYGPKGIGALYVHKPVRPRLVPVSFGGGQERGLRPGTLPTHQIVGFGAACDVAGGRLQAERARCETLRSRLWEGLQPLGGVHLNGGDAPHVAQLLNVSFEGVEGESLLHALPDLAVASGSACNSASGEPSYVLRALGRDTQLAQSSLRFSLGHDTTSADIDFTIAAVSRAVRQLRALSPAHAGESDRQAAPGGGADTAHLPERSGRFGAARDNAQLVAGEAGAQAQGSWVRFELLVRGDVVRDARFQIYGCPHTTDVAHWITAQLPGRRCSALVPGSPREWACERQVPAAKLGRLLVIEDALQSCLRHWRPDE
ncbi:MAG: aminotransferase class V-fold PLP-dependent enzyme [Sinobacteraceae bacterium]|nr:aminotransferase class V-fold PLP-dependent enzyme [Nevskiaceae bacterium]